MLHCPSSLTPRPGGRLLWGLLGGRPQRTLEALCHEDTPAQKAGAALARSEVWVCVPVSQAWPPASGPASSRGAPGQSTGRPLPAHWLCWVLSRLLAGHRALAAGPWGPLAGRGLAQACARSPHSGAAQHAAAGALGPSPHSSEQLTPHLGGQAQRNAVKGPQSPLGSGPAGQLCGAPHSSGQQGAECHSLPLAPVVSDHQTRLPQPLDPALLGSCRVPLCTDLPPAGTADPWQMPTHTACSRLRTAPCRHPSHTGDVPSPWTSRGVGFALRLSARVLGLGASGGF